MKRAEALSIIAQEMGKGTEDFNSPWLRVWERLGMIKLDLTPLTEMEALASAIGAAKDSGPLTAVRVARFLEDHGYAVKPK
jgi:hypothetical protein